LGRWAVLALLGSTAALTAPWSRRATLGSTAALLPAAAFWRPQAGNAAEAKITDCVRLEFVQQISAEDQKLLQVNIGLFGVDAPTAVGTFKELASSTLRVPCQDLPDDPEMIARQELSRRNAYKTCEGAVSEPVTYRYSQVWRVLDGRRVDGGAVQGKFALRKPPSTPTTEASSLSHDAAGLLSVRRGGGTFDFGLTAAPTPEYDDEFAVIGRVLDEDGLAAVRYLASVPVVKAADAFGQGQGGSASREKACAYGSPNSYCSQNKPLKKVTLVRTSLL